MAQCPFPREILNPKFKLLPNQRKYLTIPCGICAFCKKRKSNEWFTRFKEEMSVSKKTLFVTLTYSDDELPLDGNVCKKDFQMFFDRFRKQLPNGCCKYYCVSEYGPNGTRRPHYHFLLFIKDYVQIPYIPTYLRASWSKGFITISVANDNRLRYMAGYYIFKSDYPKDKLPNFTLISKNLGITYVEKYKNWHLSKPSERLYVPELGSKYPMPRYFKDKIFGKSEKLEISKFYEDRASEEYEKYMSMSKNEKKDYLENINNAQRKIYKSHKKTRKL